MKPLISLLIYPPYPYTSLPLHFFTHATPLYSLTPVNTRYPCYVLSVSSMLSVSCMCAVCLVCVMLCCSSRASISCVYLVRLSRASVLLVSFILPPEQFDPFDPFDPFQIFQAFDSYYPLSNSSGSIGSIRLPLHALQRVKINFFKRRGKPERFEVFNSV